TCWSTASPMLTCSMFRSLRSESVTNVGCSPSSGRLWPPKPLRSSDSRDAGPAPGVFAERGRPTLEPIGRLTMGGREMLQLRLFGAPEVLLDGEPVRFYTSKAVALLSYLAVTVRRQQRDVLAALLWPELDQTKARGALRRTLSV